RGRPCARARGAGPRGRAPGSLARPAPPFRAPGGVVEAGAADNAEHGFGHGNSRDRRFERIAAVRSARDRAAGLLRGAGVRPTKGSLTRANIRSAVAAWASPGAISPPSPPSSFLSKTAPATPT